jgi:hypothetical protein
MGQKYGSKWVLDRDQKGTIFVYHNQACRGWTSDFGTLMEILKGKVNDDDLIILKGFGSQKDIDGETFNKEGLNLEE